MSLKEMYQLIDQGKLESLFEHIKSLEGQERLGGELWKVCFTFYAYTEVDQANAIVDSVLSQCLNDLPLKSFTRCW